MSEARVRAGEELDAARVDAWLKAQLPDLAGTPEVSQYSGGASSWTYRLRYDTHDLVLRRPPAGTKAKSAHDMGREYRIQKALKSSFPLVPEMIALCNEPSVIGCEFYVMQRLEGLILRRNLPKDLTLTPDQTRKLCHNVIDTLIALHGVDIAATGLLSIGKGAGYARRQIEGWCDRYRKARTWNVPRFEKVMNWIEAHIPDDVANCVVHNAFRFDNVVLDPHEPARVIGVLDWEMGRRSAIHRGPRCRRDAVRARWSVHVRGRSRGEGFATYRRTGGADRHASVAARPPVGGRIPHRRGAITWIRKRP